MRRIAAVVMLAFSLAVSCAQPQPIDRAKADERAREELERYAKLEGYRLELFTAPKVSDYESDWLYSYNYNGEPKYELVIDVHRDGRAELSRMDAQKQE